MARDTKKAPFSIYSSSVDTGYASEISSSFLPGIDITNLHSDEYGSLRDEPMQGPFTYKYVGGSQHRHVDLNDGNDTLQTRPELFYLSMSAGTLRVIGTDSTVDVNRPRATFMRDEFAKRPLNVKNIRQMTGSTIIGNYTHDYEVVQTAGRFINNRAFVESQGEGFAQYVTTQFVTGAKDPNRALPDFDLTGSNKFVFVNRFNAPGGTDVSSRGVLDTYAEEYAVNNVMFMRNNTVRSQLRSDLARHTPKAGFGKPTKYHNDNRNSKVSLLRSTVNLITERSLVYATAIDSTDNKIYWTERGDDLTDSSYVYRSDLDGTSVEQIVEIPPTPTNTSIWGIALDLDARKVYWSDPFDGISRSNLDGTNVEIGFVTDSGPGFERYIALDTEKQIVYWASYLLPATSDGGVASASYDGSNEGISIPSPDGSVYGIDYEPITGMLYWTVYIAGDSKIRRARPGAALSEVEDLVTGLDIPGEIKVDYSGQKMYWTDSGTGKIQASNLDGTEIVDLVSDLPYPQGLSLDVDINKIYFADEVDISSPYDKTGVIKRTDLHPKVYDNGFVTHEIPQADLRYAWINASAVTTEEQLPGHQNSSSIAYEPFDDIQYVSSSDFVSFNLSGGITEGFRGLRYFGKSITDATLGGSSDPAGGAVISSSADTSLNIPDMEIDPHQGAMYILGPSTSTTSSITRADIDGTNPKELSRFFSGSSTGGGGSYGSYPMPQLRGITVDTSASMVYWAADYTGSTGEPSKVWKQRTNGLPLETEKFFFITNNSTHLVYSASVDANGVFSDVGPIRNNVTDGYGLAVDNLNRKVYWTRVNATQIYLSNFDGTGLFSVVQPTSVNSRGMDISANDNLIVWAESAGTDIIRTASLGGDLDGTILSAADGLNRPYGINIDPENKKIYFTQVQATGDFVGRCNYDGSDLTFLTGINSVLDPGSPAYSPSLSVDRLNKKLYVISTAPDPATETRIYKCDLDGENPELILTYELEDGPRDIQVDPYADRLYFSGYTDSTGIFSCSLSNPGTSSTENLFGQPLGGAYGSEGVHRIQVYGPQTKEVYTFPSGTELQRLAIDSCKQEIYYTEFDPSSVGRLRKLDYSTVPGTTSSINDNLDITGVFLRGVAYDDSEEILYYTNLDTVGGTGGIYRTTRISLPQPTASLIVPNSSLSASAPVAGRLSLDKTNKKIYFADNPSGSVSIFSSSFYKADFDGSNLEKFYTTIDPLEDDGQHEANFLLYNPVDNGLYWSGYTTASAAPVQSRIRRWRAFDQPGDNINKVWTDFAGVNFHIYEPVNLSTNTAGHSTFSSSSTSSCTPNDATPAANNSQGIVQYLNAHGPGHTIDYRIDPDNNPSSIGKTAIFNSLMLHRNGPYHHPSWKMVRTGENKVAREMKKQNIISVEDPAQTFNVISNGNKVVVNPKGSNTSTNFTEPLVTSKYRPLKHVVQTKILSPQGNPKLNTIKSTYANNLYYFANINLNNALTLTKKESKQAYDTFLEMYDDEGFIPTPDNPIQNFLTLRTSEVVYPKEENTFLSLSRTRNSYSEVAGYGVNGYDKQYGTQRTFWRDNVKDRQRSYTEALSDGTITVPGYFNSFNNRVLEPFYGESSLKAGSVDAHLGGRSVWPIDRASDLEFESLTNIDLFSEIIGPVPTPDPVSRWPLRTLASQNTGELNKGNFSFILAYSGASPSNTLFTSPTLENNGFFGLFQLERTFVSVPDADPYQNIPLDYCYFLGGYQSGSGVSGSSAPYSSSLDHGLNYKIQEESGKKPWFDSYDDYSSDIRYIAKDYSVIPEYKSSDHIEYYLTDRETVFRNNKIFNLKGAELSSSAETETTDFSDDFFREYCHSDISSDYTRIAKDHKKISPMTRVELRCKGMKKLLPYNGFYPQTRTLQMASLLSQSLFPYIGGQYIDLSTPELEQATRPIQINAPALQPFFSPGILYNTIKSGIAVDWPLYTGSIFNAADYNFNDESLGNIINRVSASSDPIDVYGEEWLWTYQMYGSASNYRLPFETLASLRYGIPVSSSDGEGSVWFTNHEVDLDNKETLVNEISPNVILSFDWDHEQSLPLFEMAMNNFLAETVRFFIKGQNLFSISSKPQSEWQVLEANKPYTMDVVLYKKDLEMSLAYHSSDHPLDTSVYSSGSKMNGRYFGPPVMRKPAGSYAAFGSGFLDEYAYNDPAYAPYTPPYFEGAARATITFVPDETRKYTVDEIFSGSVVTYQNQGFDGDYANSIAANSAMRISSSVNIFGKKTILKQTYQPGNNQSALDTQGVQFASSDLSLSPAPAEDSGLTILESTIDSTGENDIWTITPKFECPVLDFSGNLESLTGRTTGSGGLTDTSIIQTSGFGRGMWANYGSIPTGSQGIWMGVVNTVKDGDPNNGSLAAALGFDYTERTRVGEIADNKEISEAIVAIPFLDYSIPKDTENSVYTTEVISKNLIAIEPTIFETQRVNIEKGKAAISEQDFGMPSAIQETSISDMIEKMKKYVLPPQLNFLEFPTQVDPFVMYVLEFNHILDRQDLSDIWQGVMPKISITAREDESIISHNAGRFELFGGKNFPENMRWLVFKAKRKASYSYYELLPDLKDKSIKKNFSPRYSYNWPYDNFSLVELAKIEVTTHFENLRGMQQIQTQQAAAIGATTTTQVQSSNSSARTKENTKSTKKRNKGPTKR